MRLRHLGLAAGALLFSILTAAILSPPPAVYAQAPSVYVGPPMPGPAAPRPQTPPRDNSAVPTGTSRIQGRVVAADTGVPLRRAMVRVSASELRINRIATTDAEGRFEITELPAGRYNVYVTRSGYVSLQFGQRRPFESGKPLDIAQSQVLEKIDFALPRGGVIAGRITDELGEPMAGVRMQAMRHQYLPTGERQLVPAGGMGVPFGFVTNDLGEFRLYGLMPGTYVVSATPNEAETMMPRDTSQSPSNNEGHGITYYPGTINPEEAQPLSVGIAEEAHAAFALVPSKMTSITGIVRTSSGKPPANVMLGLRRRVGASGFSMRGFPMSPDGSFNIANVPPGDHWLEIVPRSANEEAGSLAITADGRDITGLVITTSPGATISGRVMFEAAFAADTQKPARIMLTPADPSAVAPMRSLDNTQGIIDEDGRFQINGAFGRVLFAISGVAFNPPPPGWSVKSVRFNGADITDVPLDISEVGSAAGIEIVLTNRQTTLSGTVKGARGEPVTEYTVAIFPALLEEGAVASRYTRVARPDQQGRFEVRGLPPGDYFAAAVESLEQGTQWDPAFRRQMEPAARRFRLAEGQSSTIELPLIQ